MRQIPPHETPSPTESALREALFHYTTADGLFGILKSNSLWCTSCFCTNDESELQPGRETLVRLFRENTRKMLSNKDRRIEIFLRRGVDPYIYAGAFESQVYGQMIHALGVYVSCFCKPHEDEDFRNGLLSQWRGYGEDGGYAIQFNRSNLETEISNIESNDKPSYLLNDVFYSYQNVFQEKLLEYSDDFSAAYHRFLDVMVEVPSSGSEIPSPIDGLTNGALEALFEYLIHTKSPHFSEENECRLSILGSPFIEYEHFVRRGMIVPYVNTPDEFNISKCIDWVIVGPDPRQEVRVNAVRQLIKSLGLKIKVRPSHIPYSRF